jgi:hypothetical protein
MADPRVVTVMREFKRDLLARETAQMSIMTRRWLQVEKALQGDLDALLRKADEWRKDGREPTRAMIMGEERYRSLIAQANAEARHYQDYAETVIANEQRRLGELGIEHATEAIRAAGGVAFDILPRDAVEYMTGLCGDGSPLFSLLKGRAIAPDAVNGLTDALVKGIGAGYNPVKVARLMADGLAAGLQKALVIARTEQLRVYRTANVAEYRESGVVSSFKRMATKDKRTCLACLARDGEVIELGREMYDHPAGRCTQVPNIDGLPPTQFQTGAEWFAKQSTSEQREMLGGYYDAWKDGQFKFSDLARTTHHDTWGDGLRVASLTELGVKSATDARVGM